MKRFNDPIEVIFDALSQIVGDRDEVRARVKELERLLQEKNDEFLSILEERGEPRSPLLP